MIEGYDWDYLYVEMYHRVRRKPIDGSLGEAVKCHAQACGFVAYAFDVHPDSVAQAVKYAAQLARSRPERLADDSPFPASMLDNVEWGLH